MYSVNRLRMNSLLIQFEYIVSVCSNSKCLSHQLSLKGAVQGSKNNLVGQLMSQLSLCKIMVQARTNIGQLVSQLSLSESD